MSPAFDELEEVTAAMHAHGPIRLEHVRRWMASTSIEAQGATAHLVTYPPFWERIEPPLPTGELEAFLFPYYERCLRENPSGEWVDTRYGTAGDLVGWFQAVPPDEDVNKQELLARLRDLLARIYLDGDQGIRDAIVCGTLEHVLEEPRWRPFFDEWRQHPVLGEAYSQAMEWALEHEIHDSAVAGGQADGT